MKQKQNCCIYSTIAIKCIHDIVFYLPGDTYYTNHVLDELWRSNWSAMRKGFKWGKSLFNFGAILFIILIFSVKNRVIVSAANIDVVAEIPANPTADTDNLRNAIDTAEDGDTISLSGELLINDVITITNKKITISGGDSGTDVLNGDIDGNIEHKTPRLFVISGEDAEVVFEGITIRNFDCTRSADAENYMLSPVEIKSGAKLTVKSGTYENNVGGTGGVMHVYDGATLMIEDGTFDGNKAENGGAIMSGWWTAFNDDTSDPMPGKLAIDGGTFKNNTAGISSENSEGGFRPISVVGNAVSFGGGAIWTNGGLVVAGGEFFNNTSIRCYGGAIFVNAGTDNYLYKGDFHDNTSYKLGGAIYSEEKSLTHFGKAGIYENKAGHFGGGLWLCPSGQGDFNTLGFAAIFGNEVDLDYDGNLKNNHTEYEHADWFNPVPDATFIGGAAGDDFAIMYPNKPSSSSTSSVNLASQWFTYTKAYWKDDGRPTKYAAGYYYKGGNSEDPYPGTHSGFEVMDGSIDPAFETDGEDKEFDPGTAGYALALKAYGDADWNDFSDENKANAKDQTNLKIYDNTAYWSGGGVGTNGKVVFQQFGILSWLKRDENSNALVGSTWTLVYPDGSERDIEDNSDPDVDSEDGVFMIKGLPAGTFYLKEKESPSGYILNPYEYTATITDEDAFGLPEKIIYIGDDSEGSIYNYEAPKVQVQLYKKLRDETKPLDAFEFTITALSAKDFSGNPVTDAEGNVIDIPLPASTTAYNTTADAGGTGYASFGEISYSYPGVYTYRISETVDSTKELIVVVTVSYDSVNHGKLKADVTYNGSTSVATIVNGEAPDKPDPSPPDPDDPDEPDEPDEQDKPNKPRNDEGDKDINKDSPEPPPTNPVKNDAVSDGDAHKAVDVDTFVNGGKSNGAIRGNGRDRETGDDSCEMTRRAMILLMATGWICITKRSILRLLHGRP